MSWNLAVPKEMKLDSGSYRLHQKAPTGSHGTQCTAVAASVLVSHRSTLGSLLEERPAVYGEWAAGSYLRSGSEDGCFLLATSDLRDVRCASIEAD